MPHSWLSETDNDIINTLPMYYFEEMNSLWHNAISHGYEELHVLFKVIVDTWAKPVSTRPPTPLCPRVTRSDLIYHSGEKEATFGYWTFQTTSES